MKIPTGEYKFQPIPVVISGIGSVQKITSKLDSFGAKRAVIMTGRTLAIKTDLVQKVKNILGERCVGVFSRVSQHVPRECIVEGAKFAREANADILISLGGSSVTDATKGMRLVLAESDNIDEFFKKYDRTEVIKDARFFKPQIPQIAIPTTLSGSEFRSHIAVTDMARKYKDVFDVEQIIPGVVVLDPEMTAATPKELWASTGIKDLSDAFMKVCSPDVLPFYTGLSMNGIKLVDQYLVLSVKDPSNLEARSFLQHAAWISSYGMARSRMSIVAELRHQIGAMYNVAHGVASTIIFPHCLDFNLPYIKEYMVPVAGNLGIQFKDENEAANAVSNRFKDIIKGLELPSRLRDVGVPHEAVQIIARTIMEARVKNNRVGESEKDIIGILEKAW